MIEEPTEINSAATVTSPAPPCCALYTWDMSGLNIAVPKKRGSGYLARPYGHHSIWGMNQIAFEESVDMCGLDGYLNLEYRYVEIDARSTIIDRVMPRIAEHYGFVDWREDYHGFWEVVQGSRHNNNLFTRKPTPCEGLTTEEIVRICEPNV